MADAMPTPMDNLRPMTMIRAKSTTNVNGTWKEYSDPAIGIVLYYDAVEDSGSLGIFSSKFFHSHQVLEVLMENATDVYNNMVLCEIMESLTYEVAARIKQLEGTTVDTSGLVHYRDELQAQSERYRRKAYDAMPEAVAKELMEKRNRTRKELEKCTASDQTTEESSK